MSLPERGEVWLADLEEERDAVESVLKEMDVDGERFETWPSTPNHPIEECLQRVEEADAFILQRVRQ